MTGKFTLGKRERLKSRKQIKRLFLEGKKIIVAPFVIFYLDDPVSDLTISPAQFAISISAKNFKKAVERNRIKRLTREAYRLQKASLYRVLENKRRQLMVFFIYTGKDIPDFKTIKEKVELVLKKLEKIIDEKSPSNT